MASTTLVPVRSPSCASTLACVGVCGYLVGLALPLARPFDLPLVFLVLLAAADAVMGLATGPPAPRRHPGARLRPGAAPSSLAAPTRFAAFSSWRRSFRRSCSFVLSGGSKRGAR
jgi:hypothetical protein